MVTTVRDRARVITNQHTLQKVVLAGSLHRAFSSGSLKNIQIRYFQGVLYHYVTEIGDGCVLLVVVVMVVVVVVVVEGVVTTSRLGPVQVGGEVTGLHIVGGYNTSSLSKGATENGDWWWMVWFGGVK